MPRNKRNIDREKKLNEILEHAHTQFLEYGYEGTSMAKIAKASGVAQNTIYWYFKNKDELFANVINEAIRQNLDGESQDDETLSTSIQRRFNIWKQYRSWGLTLHQRISQSEALRETHDNLHRFTDKSIEIYLLNKGIPNDLMQAIVKFFRYTVEGMLIHFDDDALDEASIKTFIQFISEAIDQFNPEKEKPD